MAHDVFISFAVEDETTAGAVCVALEASEVRCWVAPRDVLPGADYAQAIVEAITQSRVMVLVFSSRSNQSPHVRREVERAVSRGIPILPFRIEDVPLSPSLEYFIGTVHWLDALTPPLDEHLQHLVETMRLLLSRAEKPEGVALVPQAAERAPPVETTTEVEAEAAEPARTVEAPAEVEAEAPEPAPTAEAEADKNQYVAEAERKLVPRPSRGARLALAGLGARAAAFGLDWLFAGAAALLLCVLLLLPGTLTGASSENGWQVTDAPPLLALFLTPICYLWISNSLGRSPGKRLLRLAVVRNLPRENRALSSQEAKAMRPGWRRGFLRTVVSLVGLFLLGLGYWWTLRDEQRRPWHDHAVGTLVVQVD
jgi:uncharacterized RDD family membrane protein YckC